MRHRDPASRDRALSAVLPLEAPPALPSTEVDTRPANDVVSPIAANVRRTRLERRLSRTQLARGAGLTEARLARIETGAETPTIPLVWRLAKALEVPFGRLAHASSAVTPARATGPRLVRRLVLGTAAGPDRTALYEITLAPGGREPRLAGDPHTLESLLVTAGTLTVRFNGQERVLSTGDTLALPGRVAREYVNTGALTAIAYLKVSPHRAD